MLTPSRQNLEPNARFLRYWALFLVLLLAPVLLAIPHMRDAVPQAMLVAAGLVAMRVVTFRRPIEGGARAMVGGGVLAVGAATAMVFTLAAAYVMRFEASVVPGGWQQALAGTAYIVASDQISVWFVAWKWPESAVAVEI